jgi:hypothetical protein
VLGLGEVPRSAAADPELTIDDIKAALARRFGDG